MTDINPPARTRVRPTVLATSQITVAPRARVRPMSVSAGLTPIVQPRARTRAPADPATNPWYIPPGARPLGVLQRTHNGFDPKHGELPDPRFKPLLIIMPRGWRTGETPGYVNGPFETALAWTVADVPGQKGVVLGTAYIGEWLLRNKLGYRGMADPVYEAIRAELIARWEQVPGEKNDKAITMVHKGMLIREDDGDLSVDPQKNSGPFHCEAVLGVEHRYRDKLEQIAVHRVAS